MSMTTMIEVPLWFLAVWVFVCGVALGKWLFVRPINRHQLLPQESTKVPPRAVGGYQPGETMLLRPGSYGVNPPPNYLRPPAPPAPPPPRPIKPPPKRP